MSPVTVARVLRRPSRSAGAGGGYGGGGYSRSSERVYTGRIDTAPPAAASCSRRRSVTSRHDGGACSPLPLPSRLAPRRRAAYRSIGFPREKRRARHGVHAAGVTAARFTAAVSTVYRNRIPFWKTVILFVRFVVDVYREDNVGGCDGHLDGPSLRPDRLADERLTGIIRNSKSVMITFSVKTIRFAAFRLLKRS